MHDVPTRTIPPGYAELRRGMAQFPVPGCTVVHVTGPDAVRFVDAFTTAAVGSMESGASAEGMLLDTRGQVMALVHLLRDGDDVWLLAWPGVGCDIAAHLERYHIRERLTVTDASARWEVRGLAGPRATGWLSAAGVLPGVDIGRVKTVCVPGVWLGGWLLLVPGDAAAGFDSACLAEGIATASAAAVDTVRIELGYPLPRDIPDRALPQELGRDREAISFTKGCYLGQETVARIDALGHVNRHLVRLASAAPLPAAGSEVVSDGEGGAGVPVGRVTSMAWSADAGAGIALATVTARGLEARERLTVAGEPVRPVTGRFP